MSTLFPSARIILVEPSTSSAATARLNLLGRHVVVEQAAIWGARKGVRAAVGNRAGSNAGGVSREVRQGSSNFTGALERCVHTLHSEPTFQLPHISAVG